MSKKSKIVYERLKKVYGYKTDEQLGEVFGITKQGMGLRKKRGVLDLDEIMMLFPDVNKDWLFSEDLDELRRLPVQSQKKKNEELINFDLLSLKKDKLSDQTKLQLLEQIESIVKILKANL